jgi:sporulation protein YlmC with PRC-barrel domain
MHAMLLTASAIAILSAGTALAQSNQQAQPQQQQPAQAQAGGAQGQQQVAQQCLDDLAAFRERMDEEGYWLTGWRDMGVGYGVPHAGAAGAPPPDTTGGTAAGAPPPATAPTMAGPWGGVGWAQSPNVELRALYTAAGVFARRGDEQGCQTVLSELNQMYDQYSAQLRQAGVEPGEVTGWRVQQLASAQPVSELNRRLRIDNIVGTDLRNPQDQYLGTVEDVVLNPQTGDISYVIVERGGFLGIGENQVPVPWQALQATPGLNTFVLAVDEAVMNGAPQLEPGMAGAGGLDQRRQEIDQYWQQHRSGG